MRVSVYLLRHKGERRPLDDVRASTPAVGSIRVTREPGGRLGTWQRGAFLLVGAELSEPVLQLHNIQLQSWDERGIVIAGTEYEYDRKDRTAYRQAWLIKPHAQAGTATHPAVHRILQGATA